jgi:hypothetical protein
MISKNFVFKIGKCSRNDCYDSESYIYDLSVASWVIQEKMDFTLFDERPVYRVMEPQGKYLMNKKISFRRHQFLQLNSIKTYDDPYKLGTLSIDQIFYQVGMTIDDAFVIEADPNYSYYQEIFWINGLATSYERKVYNLLDLLGDLGGVLEFLLILFSIFLNPISEFSYYLKLAK